MHPASANSPLFQTPIILIGPMSAGKSTIAVELAKLTKVPNVPMDRVRWYYYFKKGYTLEYDLSLPNLWEQIKYWKPFEADAVDKIISEFQNAIIDFGAGHSDYEDPTLFASVQSLLKPLKNIFHLLPSPDLEESLQICNARLEKKKNQTLSDNEIKSNRHFIFSPSTAKLAKKTIYTKDKTPIQCAQEILHQLS